MKTILILLFLLPGLLFAQIPGPNAIPYTAPSYPPQNPFTPTGGLWTVYGDILTTGTLTAEDDIFTSGTLTAIGNIAGANLSGTNTGDQFIFQTIATTSGTNPVAETTADTLTLTAGTGMTVTGDASTDTVTVATTITQSSGANPTATASQSAVNGVAATFMRSDGAPAISTIYPSWTKYTIDFEDFSPGGAVDTFAIELLSLPARGVIHAVVIKHSTAFSGGTTSAATLSVGIVGNATKYAGAFDVFQAAGNTVFQLASTVGAENFGAATSIETTLTLTNDDVENLAAGVADIWVQTSVLQAP